MTELVTDRLLLRRAREEDVNDLHAVFSHLMLPKKKAGRSPAV